MPNTRPFGPLKILPRWAVAYFAYRVYPALLMALKFIGGSSALTHELPLVSFTAYNTLKIVGGSAFSMHEPSLISL